MTKGMQYSYNCHGCGAFIDTKISCEVDAGQTVNKHTCEFCGNNHDIVMEIFEVNVGKERKEG